MDDSETEEISINSWSIHDLERSDDETFFKNHELTAAELKRNFHGDINQLKLLLLCLWRGMKKRKSFGFITEVMEAGKFDDIVVPYICNNEKKIEFAQVKHSQDSSPLTYAELINTNDGDFSLIKYFNSFCQIESESNPLYRNFIKDTYILITNRTIDKIGNQITLTPTPLNNTFFYSKENEFKGYKIDVNEEHEIFKLLESQEDLKLLAEALSCAVINNKKLSLENYILSVYHVVLMEKKILEKIDNNETECHFRANFINNNQNLPPSVCKLRSMLFEEFKILFTKKQKEEFLSQKIVPQSFLNQYTKKERTKDDQIITENRISIACDLARILNGEKLASVKNVSVDFSMIINEGKLKIDSSNPMIPFWKKLREEYNYETEICELLKKTLKKTPWFGKLFRKPGGLNQTERLCYLLCLLIKSINNERKVKPKIKPDDNSDHIIHLNDDNANNLKLLAGHVLVYQRNESYLIFSEAFFNDKMPEIFQKFKTKLVEQMGIQNLPYDDLRLLKFHLKIPIFHSYFEDREVKNDFPTDSGNMKEKVKEFLKKFILIISPHEKEITKIINNEATLAPTINLLDPDFVVNHTFVEVLNWMKSKKSTEYTKQKAEALFETLRIKISTLMLAGNNSEYCKKLREYFPIRTPAFQNSLKSVIRNFLNSDSCILFLTSDGPICTLAVKVEESLRDIGSEIINGYSLTHKDSFVFNPLSFIIRLQDDVLNILGRPKQKTLLIIVCDNNVEMCQQILSKVNETNNNKVLFIGSKSSKILKHIKEDDQHYDENNNFSCLTAEAQKYLHGKKIVKFYDENVSLNDVFDLETSNDFIDLKMFDKLCNDVEIKLPEEDKKYDKYDINYYVSRNFYSCIEISESVINNFKNVSTDAIVIEQSEQNNSVFKNVFSVKYEEVEAKYMELCKKYKNVHWLKKELNKFWWIKSQGSISKLVKHQIYSDSENNECDACWTTTKIYSEKELLNFIKNIKFLILSNVAGMGKSIISSKIFQCFQKMSAAFLVIRINFMDHSSILQCIKNDDDNFMLDLENIDEQAYRNGKQLINLIGCLENVTSINQEFSEKLFQHYFKGGRLVIMFDGFDEIEEETLKAIVLKLIVKLKSSTKNIIWITTRSGFKQTLETTFDLFALKLTPFDTTNQLCFLNKYWKSRYSKMIGRTWNGEKILNVEKEQRIHTYALKFLDIFKNFINEKNHNFVGIPLQLEMLAEIHKRRTKPGDIWEGCFDYMESGKEENPILPTAINLFECYRKFVEIKVKDKYYYEKTGMQKSNPKYNKFVENEFTNAMLYHQLFALQLLVTDENLRANLLDSKKNELIEWGKKIIAGNENAGIITDIIDGKPHFVHLTFAEYFAAVYLKENCFNIIDTFFSYVNCICANCSRVFIYCIIELLKNDETFAEILQGKNLLTYSAEKGYLNIVKTLIKETDVPDCDNNNKTSLHYAAANDRKEIAGFLLAYYDDIRKRNILRNANLKKPEYASSNLVFYVNKKDNMNKTALYYAIQNKNWDIAEQLVLKGDDCISCDEIIKEFSMHVTDKITTLSTSDKYWNISKPIFFESGKQYPRFEEMQYCRRTYATEKHYLHPIIDKIIPHVDMNKLCYDQFIRLTSILWYHGRLQLIKDVEIKINDNEKKDAIFTSQDREIYPLDRINESPYICDEEKLDLIEYLFQHGGTMISELSSARHLPSGSTNPHFIAILTSAAEYGHIKTFKCYFHEKQNLADHYLSYAFSYHQKEIVTYVLSEWNQEINHNTPLHVAMFSDSISVKHLDEIFELTVGNLHKESKDGRAPMLMAIDAKHGLPKIKYLVEKDENVIALHKEQILSALNENPCFIEDDILRYLLEQLGCNINQTLHQVMKSEIQFWGMCSEEREQKMKEIYKRKLEKVVSRMIKEEKKKAEEDEDEKEEEDEEEKEDEGMEEVDKKKKETETETETEAEEDIRIANQALIIYLIKHGADVNERDIHNKIPLHYACQAKLSHVITVLLEHGSKYKDEDGCLAPELSIEETFNDIKSYFGVLPVKFINTKNYEDKTLLHIGIENSSIIGAWKQTPAWREVLIAHEDHLRSRKAGTRKYKSYSFSSLNSKDRNGKTPLMIAIEKNNDSALKELVKCGVTFDIKNCHTTDADIVKIIDEVKSFFYNLKNNNDDFYILDYLIDVRNEHGETPLHCVIKSKKHNILQKLIKMGAYMEAENNDKKTPLHFAADINNVDAVNILLLQGSIFETTTFYQEINDSKKLLKEIAHLFFTIKGKNPDEIVDVLSAKFGKDLVIIVNARDEHGYTLLHYTLLWNYSIIMKFLLKSGSVINNVTKEDEEFRDHVNKKLFGKISKLFDDMKNFNEHVKDLKKEHDFDETFIINVRKHVDYKGVSYKGLTLLHAAVLLKHIDVIKWLLNNGADINAEDYENSTVKQFKSYKEDIKVKACIDSFST